MTNHRGAQAMKASRLSRRPEHRLRMRVMTWTVAVVVGHVFALSNCAAAPLAGTIAIRHVSVVPMDREIVVPDQTIIVTGSEIAEVGPADRVRVPPGVTVLDGSGKFVLPGLVDFHAHPKDARELINYLRYGDTTLITLGGEGYSLAHQLADVRPNIMSTTLQIDGNPPINPRFYAIARPEFAGPALDFELSRGAVLVKVYSWLHKPEFDAIVEAAHQRHISVVGHLPEALTPEQALAGVNVVAHAEEYLKYLGQPLKQVRIDYLAELTRKNEVSVVPNLVAYAAIARHARNPELELGQPEFAYLMPYVYQEWLPRSNRYFNREKPAAFVARIDAGLKTMKRLVLTLHRAGVPLFSGTDASIFCYPGLCLLEELDLLHEAGLTRYETLQCATANPGRFVQHTMHRPERFGTITRGSRADLLLLSDNPLESFDPLQSPLGVMVAGRWLSADELEHMRDAMKPDLERRRALVMEYERLEASTNHTTLRAFLSRLDPKDRLFGENVVLQDAAALRRADRPADALGLLNEMTRLMPESHALWNAIGSLKQAAGDLAGARAAYERSLALRPVNGVAVTALEEPRAAISNTSK